MRRRQRRRGNWERRRRQRRRREEMGRGGGRGVETLLFPRPESFYDDITNEDNAYHFFIYNIYPTNEQYCAFVGYMLSIYAKCTVHTVSRMIFLYYSPI